RRRDAPAWVRARARAQDWLEPWEASAPEVTAVPWIARQTVSSFLALRRAVRQGARRGTVLPFVITVDGAFAGMISVGEITRGAARSGALGYWVDERLAGRGIGTTAVALLVEHCFGPVGLHRLEAWVRPENTASRRLLTRVGFREEGLARDSLWVDGAWRDHLVFALCASDERGGSGAVQHISAERRSVG
ncbi:MAG TPA: GNAT family protein, partial [Mycobacteriales bacterium]|nr:GNAT family protein [Mycobacteriales bacterium]